MILWDYIVTPEQHAVQRAGSCHQLLTGGRSDQEFNQLVDHGILDASEVAAAGHLGRSTAPEFALLVARRFRLSPDIDDHVEVEGAVAIDVLRGIDQPDARLDPEPPEIALKRQDDALHGRTDQQDLEAHRLTAILVGQQQRLWIDLPARLLEETEGLP